MHCWMSQEQEQPVQRIPVLSHCYWLPNLNWCSKAPLGHPCFAIPAVRNEML